MCKGVGGEPEGVKEQGWGEVCVGEVGGRRGGRDKKAPK